MGFVKIFALVCIISLLNISALQAQKKEPTRILIVFDCSYSMTAKWDKDTRMTAAKSILTRIVDSLKNHPEIILALRCYGHQYTVADKNCTDTKLEVPFKKNNSDEIIDFVKKVQPSGWTPIAYSLTQAAADFPDNKGKNVVILVTDGIEECGGDPCVVSQQLQARNVLLKPYIIGIGLDDQKMTFFDCVGKYYNPKNEKELGTIFTSVISQALDNTSLQVELLDSKKMPTHTNVEMTLINAKNNKAEYNYFHTMNRQNKPDTFFIDPSYTYNLQLNTTPPVYKNNISLKVGTHNVVKVDAPQGNLSVSCASAREYGGLPCLVRRAGKSDIIYVQEMYNTHKYLTGSYDLEILTLPRIKFSNVKVTEGNTPNKIVIPAPGKLELTYSQNVIASIYILRNNTQEWVADIDGASAQRKELYMLQPGRYIVVYRRANAVETESTREATFNIISGSIYNLKLE